MKLASRLGLVAIAVCAVALAAPMASPPAAGADAALTMAHSHDFAADVTEHPYDVAVDKWGNTFVVFNSLNKVKVFDAAGALVDSFGTTGTAPGTISGAYGVEVDRWGNIYVAEGDNQRVQMFSPGYASTRTFGDDGGPGDLTSPRHVGIGVDGVVAVSDAFGSVKVYDNFAAYQRSIDPTGPVWSVAIGQDGDFVTCNDQATGGFPIEGNRVEVFSASGSPIRSWGSTGTGAGQLQRPYDVGIDPLGHVFVVESLGYRGQAFTLDGSFLTTFGAVGSGPGGLNIPYGLCAAPDRRVLVADSFNHRISSWTVTTPTEATRVAGANRYATAAAASRRAYPDGSGWVVIASGTNWPDALGGASLCGVLDAPLLLTDPASLSPETAAEMARLGAGAAYVLGGTGAISPACYAQIEAAVGAADAHRIGGANRYETAALIASETISLKPYGHDGTCFVCTGRAFPDALAAAPIAAANGWPIFLTEPTTYTAVTREMMQDKICNHGYVIGGTGAISGDVMAAVNQASNLWPIEGFGRHAGATRYQTAAAVAEIGFDGMGMLWSRPALANGANFPDALAGGVLQGSDCSVMLLTPPTSLDTSAAAALTANRDMVYEMRVIGGSGAVSDAVRDDAMGLLH